MNPKPPLGITPRDIYDEQCAYNRCIDIYLAIARFRKVTREVPASWWTELAEYQSRYPSMFQRILEGRRNVEPPVRH